MALICSNIDSGALSGTIEVNIVGPSDEFAEFTVCNNSSNTAAIGEVCFDINTSCGNYISFSLPQMEEYFQLVDVLHARVFLRSILDLILTRGSIESQPGDCASFVIQSNSLLLRKLIFWDSNRTSLPSNNPDSLCRWRVRRMCVSN